ncbi:MAG: heme-binding protein [Burkholderiales bacterium]|nr:MAG: heme-binding protein [Burkholderiales bacterium]
MAIEEPDYEVLRRLDAPDVELRRYAPYVVAQVRIDGASADRADSDGFRTLAGYIFGKNKGERRLEMTAPVTREAEPVKLEMTAPVTRSADASGFVVQFVLPKGVTLATAPEPNDPRVQLREVPASVVAVIRYSGFWSQSNYDEHLERLQAALRDAKIGWTGEPTLSRYNGPMTPWFLRRNEIWLRVEGTGR